MEQPASSIAVMQIAAVTPFRIILFVIFLSFIRLFFCRLFIIVFRMRIFIAFHFSCLSRSCEISGCCSAPAYLPALPYNTYGHIPICKYSCLDNVFRLGCDGNKDKYRVGRPLPSTRSPYGIPPCPLRSILSRSFPKKMYINTLFFTVVQ